MSIDVVDNLGAFDDGAHTLYDDGGAEQETVDETPAVTSEETAKPAEEPWFMKEDEPAAPTPAQPVFDEERVAQIAARVIQQQQAHQQPGSQIDPEMQEILRLESLTSDDYDPARASTMREARYQRQFQAQLQNYVGQMVAPSLRTQIAAQVASGLSAAAKDWIEQQLPQSAGELQSISQNKGVLRILREASENIDRKKSGPQVKAPRSEGAHTKASNLDSDTEAWIENFYQQNKDVPGMTREKLRQRVLKGGI